MKKRGLTKIFMATNEELTYAFNNFVDSLNSLKKAKEDHKKCIITQEELFDHEFYAHEAELDFIGELMKNK